LLVGYKKLWAALGLIVILGFAVLGYFGWEIYRQAPPIPERVITTNSAVLFTAETIREGQNVWQTLGGQEVGSIWGHGAYVAPDWSADWLHREARWVLDHWATEKSGTPYDQLDEETQAVLRVRLKRELRTNTYQTATGDLVISPVRAEAITATAAHYSALFGDAPELAPLRDTYALLAGTVKDPQQRHALAPFFSGRPGRVPLIALVARFPTRRIGPPNPSSTIGRPRPSCSGP
jgi:nitric oxide reductase subunit B